jgi:hypothetical protein
MYWKLGISGEFEDSSRQKEQAWSKMVEGVVM